MLAFASQYGVVDAVREVNADFQAPIAAGVSPQGPTVGAEEVRGGLALYAMMIGCA